MTTGGKEQQGANQNTKKVLSCVFLLYSSVTALFLNSLAPGPNPDGCFSSQVHYGILYGMYLVLRYITFFQPYPLKEKSRIYLS